MILVLDHGVSQASQRKNARPPLMRSSRVKNPRNGDADGLAGQRWAGEEGLVHELPQTFGSGVYQRVTGFAGQKSEHELDH